MKVTITAYTFAELSPTVAERIRDKIREELIDDNFEAFNESLAYLFESNYGLCAEPQYSLTYQQGDGFSFTTGNFLSDKILDLVQAKISVLEGVSPLYEHLLELYNKVRSSKALIVPIASHWRYPYAAKCDVKFDYFEADLADDFDCPAAVEKFEEILLEIYLGICKEFEDIGYKAYDIDNSLVEQIADESLYLPDGTVVGDKETLIEGENL